MYIVLLKLKHPELVFSLIGVTTLLLVAVFFLDRSHNTHRWIRMGIFSFQPSELAKPAIILFLAYFLDTRSKTLGDWKHTLIPAILPSTLFAVLIVKQPDLGTAMMCAAITGAVLFVSGTHLKYFGYALVAVTPSLYVLVFLTTGRP